MNPAMLHIACVKVTSVNGSGAAELSHFTVGAEELGELEGMQVKREEGVSEEWAEKTDRQQK